MAATGAHWSRRAFSHDSARDLNAHGVAVARVRLRPLRRRSSIGADRRADARQACLYLWKKFGKRMMVQWALRRRTSSPPPWWRPDLEGARCRRAGRSRRPATAISSLLRSRRRSTLAVDQRRLQARRGRGAARLAAVLAAGARQDARRCGRWRASLREFLRQIQDRRRRLARSAALSTRYEAVAGLNHFNVICDPMLDENSAMIEAHGRAAAAKNTTLMQPLTVRPRGSGDPAFCKELDSRFRGNERRMAAVY